MPDAGDAVPVDPRVVRSRGRIVDAARACFAEHGYDDTTMEAIADRAGIAKRTIYNVFADKDAVFRAAVDASFPIAARFTEELGSRMRALDDPARELPEIAVRLARDIFLGPVVPLRRLVAREAARFPDLAREYRERAPYAVVRALAEGLAALGERGVLRVDDPDAAAAHFAYLVLGAELDRRMLGDAPASAAAVERAARAGAAAFLRAYPPAPDAVRDRGGRPGAPAGVP
jgi:TetR/AcrR family transcriptional regulator, mexJK operon transcriptional repressor